jgi:hypothetical protein
MTFKAPQKQLANIIIAGVNKAGSTSLFHYLSAHPQVCGSKDKETCYFLPLLYNEPVPPIQKYIDQFSHCSSSVFRLEATPAYIYGGEKIATEIKKTLGEIKIVIILKNPVDRLISFYQRKKATFQLPENIDLREYVKLCLQKNSQELELKENQIYTGIALGQYQEYIKPWLQHFGSNLKIVFFDDLKKDTKSFMKELAKWIGIDPNFYTDFDFDIKNKSHHYKNRLIHKLAVTANNTGQRFWRTNPTLKKIVLNTYYKFNGTPVNKNDLDNETLVFLKKYFQPHNLVLSQLLLQHGYKNLPEWLIPNENA